MQTIYCINALPHNASVATPPSKRDLMQNIGVQPLIHHNVIFVEQQLITLIFYLDLFAAMNILFV